MSEHLTILDVLAIAFAVLVGQTAARWLWAFIRGSLAA